MTCGPPVASKPGGSDYDFSDDLDPMPLPGHAGPQARVMVGDQRQMGIVYLGWDGSGWVVLQHGAGWTT